MEPGRIRQMNQKIYIYLSILVCTRIMRNVGKNMLLQISKKMPRMNIYTETNRKFCVLFAKDYQTAIFQ